MTFVSGLTCQLGLPLRFEGFAQQFPDADDPFDRDALRVTVRVRIPPFAGEIETHVFSHELANLLAAIETRPAGPRSIAFHNRAGTVHFELRADPDAWIEVRPDPASPNRLSGETFVSDRELEEFAEGLRAVLREFPVNIPR